MSIYFNRLINEKVSDLRLTTNDELICKAFKVDFPEFKIDRLSEDSLKSAEAKAKWQEFGDKFADETGISNSTMLLLDSAENYNEQNTIWVTRIQFLAIEIARNREGFNDLIQKKNRQAGLDRSNFAI